MCRLGGICTAIVLATLLVGNSANAGVIVLSQFVSDGVNPPAAEVLDATLTFELDSTDLDAGTPVLTVTVDNQTVFPDEFNMTEIYFNVPDNVTAVSLSTNPGNKWVVNFDNALGGGFMANGFGMFDLQLIDGPSGGIAKVATGATAVFGIELTGTGLISQADFISELSEPVPLNIVMLAAAKFVNGPGDSSAFGATPEPATLAMLVLGALAIGPRVRRRRA